MSDLTGVTLSPTTDGYIRLRLPDHPLANKQGYVLEHRLIAWETFGPFDRSMHVHHINGVRTDNRPENLELLTAKEHAREHGDQKLIYDRQEVARLYAEGLTTTEIADRLGTYAGNVSRFLAEAGVKARTSAEVRCRNHPSLDTVRAEAAVARSATELADRLNVSIGTARGLMRKAGVAAYPVGRRPQAIHDNPQQAAELGLLIIRPDAAA